jgi:hypothetical protein
MSRHASLTLDMQLKVRTVDIELLTVELLLATLVSMFDFESLYSVHIYFVSLLLC